MLRSWRDPSGRSEVVQRGVGEAVIDRIRRGPWFTPDEWMAHVREWASSFPQRDHPVDCSRKSIYGDERDDGRNL